MGDGDDNKEKIECPKHRLDGYFDRDFVARHQATHAREEAEDRAREKLRQDAAAAKKAIRDRNEARRNNKNSKDNCKKKVRNPSPSLYSPYPTVKSTRYGKNRLK